MKAINYDTCEIDYWVPLDKDGKPCSDNPAKTVSCRVGYDVPKSEMEKVRELFSDLPDDKEWKNNCGGQLRFIVDLNTGLQKEGTPARLCCCFEDRDEGAIAYQHFVHYNADLSPLAKSFMNQFFQAISFADRKLCMFYPIGEDNMPIVEDADEKIRYDDELDNEIPDNFSFCMPEDAAAYYIGYRIPGKEAEKHAGLKEMCRRTGLHLRSGLLEFILDMKTGYIDYDTARLWGETEVDGAHHCITSVPFNDHRAIEYLAADFAEFLEKHLVKKQSKDENCR